MTIAAPYDQKVQDQLQAAIGMGQWFPPPTLYTPPNVRQLTIEAVDGGYVLKGYLQGKGVWRTVATNPHQLARLLKQWSAQFESKD